MNTAIAVSSLVDNARPTQTKNQPHDRRMANHQANRNGVTTSASGWKLAHADPLDRGVQQVRHGEREADPRAGEAVPGDQVHRQGAQPEHDAWATYRNAGPAPSQ